MRRASVAATSGREIIACGKLTTSRPSTPPSSAIGSRSTQTHWTRPGEHLVERDGTRAGNVLRRHLDAARLERAQLTLLVGRQEDVAQACVRPAR